MHHGESAERMGSVHPGEERLRGIYKHLRQETREESQTFQLCGWKMKENRHNLEHRIRKLNTIFLCKKKKSHKSGQAV